MVALLREPKQIHQKVRFLGKELKVVPGTIRTKTDMDDAWFYALSQRHHAIYDIGCNIGYTAILANLHNPNKNYLLVDPNPKALSIASSNLIHNGIGVKGQYYCAFVSNRNHDSIRFFTIGWGAAGSMHRSHAESAAAVNASIEVPTVTLDYLFQHYGWQPSLVKIDVEGAENLVLEGADDLVKKTGCTFFIELHKTDALNMEQMGDFIVSWCQKHQYTCWYLKTMERMESGKLIANRGKCHVLLQPSAMDFPEYLKKIEQGAPLPEDT